MKNQLIAALTPVTATISDSCEHTLYTLRNDHGDDVVFTGSLIAQSAESTDATASNYSGYKYHVIAYQLFTTRTGNYVIAEHLVRLTNTHEYERHTTRVTVCADTRALKAAGGYSVTAKQLYKQANIGTAKYCA